MLIKDEIGTLTGSCVYMWDLTPLALIQYAMRHVMADSPSGILSAVAPVMGTKSSSTSVAVAMTTPLAATGRISSMMSKEQQHPSKLGPGVFTQYLAYYCNVAGRTRRTHHHAHPLAATHHSPMTSSLPTHSLQQQDPGEQSASASLGAQ
jgi:hypothetical protein